MNLFYYLLKKIFQYTVIVFSLFLITFLLSERLFLDESPYINQFEEIELSDILRIKSIIEKVSFKIHDKSEKKIEITERDINILIGKFGKNFIDYPKNSFAKVNLKKENPEIALSIPTQEINNFLNNNFKAYQNIISQKLISFFQNMIKRNWLNIKVELEIDDTSKKESWLKINKIKIGSIGLSENIINYISSHLIQKFLSSDESKPILKAWDNIISIKKINNKIEIGYIFKTQNKSSLNSLSEVIIKKKDREKIIFYEKYIETLPKQGRLITVISKLFNQASERSLQSNDPIGENKSLIIALSRYYGADDFLRFINSDKEISIKNNRHTIYGRSDLSKYLIITAGISLIADQESMQLDNIKEYIIKFTYGENINVWALLASKAGLRLAGNATKSIESARQTQILLSNIKSDGELLPDLGEDFSHINEFFSIEYIEELSEIIDIYLDQTYIFKN
tara:strand:- start:682 stop:2043 length:1362 start_codon:yes stop_codon:yes gene_type:complete